MNYVFFKIIRNFLFSRLFWNYIHITRDKILRKLINIKSQHLR